jgi:hypothetical protein
MESSECLDTYTITTQPDAAVVAGWGKKRTHAGARVSLLLLRAQASE